MADTIFTKGFDPSIGSDVVACIRKFGYEEYGRNYFPHGLQYNVTWLWGRFWVENGDSYFYCREFKTANSNFFILTKSTEGDQNDERLYTGPGEAFMGYTFFDQDDEKRVLRVSAMYPGQPFECILTDDGYKVIDCNGDLELHCDYFCDGTAQYLPGQYGNKDDIMYCESFGRFSGTFCGEKITGVGGIDWSFAPPGYDYRHCKLIGALEKSWPTWFNQYEDGSYEGGCFINGMGNWNLFYYFSSETEPKLLQKFRYHISCDEKRKYVNHIDWEVDGMKFEYITETMGCTATGVANDNASDVEEKHDDTDWVYGYVLSHANKDKPTKYRYCTLECFYQRCLENPDGGNY